MPSPQPIRVATYNVHGCIGTDGRHDPERVATVIGELDADIVALQEFTYPASVALETRSPVVLTTLDAYTCALGPTRQTVTQCFGNALFTRHPIVDVHRIDLSMERREPRGALAATVDVNGTPVHVLAAHLGLRVHERRFQVRQILAYLDSVKNTLFVGTRRLQRLAARPFGRPRPRSPSRPAAAASIVPGGAAGPAAGPGVGPSVRRPASSLYAFDANGPAGVGSLSSDSGHRSRRVESPPMPKAIALIVVGLCGIQSIHAQSTTRVEFDVISIKRACTRCGRRRDADAA